MVEVRKKFQQRKKCKQKEKIKKNVTHIHLSYLIHTSRISFCARAREKESKELFSDLPNTLHYVHRIYGWKDALWIDLLRVCTSVRVRVRVCKYRLCLWRG